MPRAAHVECLAKDSSSPSESKNVTISVDGSSALSNTVDDIAGWIFSRPDYLEVRGSPMVPETMAGVETWNFWKGNPNEALRWSQQQWQTLKAGTFEMQVQVTFGCCLQSDNSPPFST